MLSRATDLLDVRGISMSTYSQAGYSDSSITNLINRAVSSGTNQIIVGNIVMADLSTGEFSDVIENGRNQTADLTSIERAVRIAHDAGLEVILKPQVAVHDAEYDQYNSASWINMVNPNLVIENPDAFFANYKSELLEFAALAERTGVTTLSIGNEMVAATKPEFTPFWLDIIDSVRGVYHGALTYAALAPVLTNASVNEITQVGFWGKLDFAGFDVYPSLYHGLSPTVEELVAGWRDTMVYGHRQDYYAFLDDMAKHVAKPVVFMETGLPSFDGASDREATSDGFIGNGQRAADQGEQADWWQAFFQVWNVDRPSWLKGVFVVNNDPGELGSYYDQNYNINGKLAEKIVSSWFGGHVALDGMSTNLIGSADDDQLFLYDPSTWPVGMGLQGHQKTVVTVVVTAGIADGQAPVLSASINGESFEKMMLQPHDSGYVADDGTHWTANATYTFELDGIVPINDLRISFDSDPVINGRRSSTFFHEVSVNGIDLQDVAYHPLGSTVAFAEKLPVNGSGGTASQWNAGYSIFDAAPWNSVAESNTLGSSANPIVVDGGSGSDTLHVLGIADSYHIERHSDGNLSLSDVAGLNQSARISGVETIVFGNGASLSVASIPVGLQVHASDMILANMAVSNDMTPFFNGAEYLGLNADVALAGVDPLTHYREHGWYEGRNASADFDTNLYLLHNPDVALSGINPLDHYVQYGRAEGRAIYAAIGTAIAADGFDAQYYLLQNPDVAARWDGDPRQHYLAYGRFEGRNPNAFFDTNGYLQANPDVAATGIDPLEHFNTNGWREGRDPSGAFDTHAYLAANPDVATSGENPLTQFLTVGAFELRDPHSDGVITGTHSIIG